MGHLSRQANMSRKIDTSNPNPVAGLRSASGHRIRTGQSFSCLLLLMFQVSAASM